MPRAALILVLCLAVPACRRKPNAAPQLSEAANKLAASEIAIGDPAYQPLLLRGFYETDGGWRWTGRQFAVAMAPPPGAGPAELILDFTLPVEVTRTIPSITLTAHVNGVEVGHHTYSK